MTTQRKTMEAIHLPPGFALAGPFSCVGSHSNGVRVVVHVNASGRYSYMLQWPVDPIRPASSFVQIRSQADYCSAAHAARVGLRAAGKQRVGGFSPRPTLRSWCAQRWQKASPYTILAGALVLILGLVRTCCPVPEGRADTMATGVVTAERVAVDTNILRTPMSQLSPAEAAALATESPAEWGLSAWYVGCLVSTVGEFEMRVYPDHRWLVASPARILRSGEAPDEATAKMLAAGPFADFVSWFEEREYRNPQGSGYEGSITWARLADGSFGYQATVQSGFLTLVDRPVLNLGQGRELIELAVAQDQQRICAFSRMHPDVDPRTVGRASVGRGQRFVRVNQHGGVLAPTGGRVWQES